MIDIGAFLCWLGIHRYRPALVNLIVYKEDYEKMEINVGRVTHPLPKCTRCGIIDPYYEWKLARAMILIEKEATP